MTNRTYPARQAERTNRLTVQSVRFAFVALGMATVTASTIPALAQSGPQTASEALAPYDPPPTETSTRYLDAVENRGLQARIQYLHPDSELDADLSRFDSEDDTSGNSSEAARYTAIAVLIAILLFLGFFVWTRRGSFLDRAGPRPQTRVSPDRQDAPSHDDPDIDRDFIARLRSETDPRVGLRKVLQRFLALAASDNEIVLKRSLTTRELLERLPGSWHHRSALQTLAQRVELVVFGGRAISREDYEECLDLAAPFLKRTER
ncbi:DUF4129 domain-containing protein [Fulvimarina sp. MAC3]|uniref:DUF4129 domain-containing protein n=1 Tax=Fulvimarina sp. MAC3 TaxID=3148887 RepID=UPI0031FD349E